MSYFFTNNLKKKKNYKIPQFKYQTVDYSVKPREVNITDKKRHLSALQTYEIDCVTAGSKPEAIITWWKGSHQVKHMAKKVNLLFVVFFFIYFTVYICN